MKPAVRRSLMAAIFVVGSVAVAISVNYATGSGLNELDQTASVVSALLGFVALIVAVFAQFRAQRSFDAASKAEEEREQLGFRLIRTFALIEQNATEYQRLLGEKPKRPYSLREVGNMMSGAGVWGHEDRIGFDLATRARNAIVHGDLDSVDLVDLRYADEKARQLLTKIRSAAST